MPRRRRPSVALAFLCAALLAAFPPPAQAWKVDAHVYAANLVLEEAFGNNFGNRDRIDYLDNAWVQWIYFPPSDGLVRVRVLMSVHIPPFGWLRVDEDMARALRFYPSLFRAGAVGPDLFPELITGQTVVHPGKGPVSGRWAAGYWVVNEPTALSDTPPCPSSASTFQ